MSRLSINDFALANPLYRNASVTFYVAVSGVKTATLATLYSGQTGASTLANPQRLDSKGKFKQPVYIAQSVIGTVDGISVPSHDTGVINGNDVQFRINSSTGYVEYSNDVGVSWTSMGNPASQLFVTTAEITPYGLSAIDGFLQAGTGAGPRALQAKNREAVSVTDFYADGVGTSSVMVDPTGVVDSTLGIQAAFNAVGNSGRLIFPSGTYKVTDAIEATASNLDIDGQGSTINCAYTTQADESGAFLWLTGNENLVHGFRVESNVATVDSASYTNGVLLKLTGNDNLCEHNYFYGGNSGAVRVYGDGNIVRGNTFEKCNNRNTAGDYGSVHIRLGVGNKVLDNDISDFFYSGISAYGDNGAGVNVVTDLMIRGNTIKGTVGTRTYSMGIYVLQGANKNLTISDNIISEVGNEGIIVFSAASQTCDGVIIHNNLIRNVDYSGIFINASTYASANISIRGNTVIMSSTVSTAYAIVLEKATDSIIKDNVVVNATTISVLMVGILVQTSTLSNNIVAGNVVKNGTTGIGFAGLRSLLQGNTVYSATTGFSYSSCDSSAIQNNMANGCTTGFSGGSGADYTLMTGNLASGCTTDFTSTTTARNMYGGSQTTEAATRNYVNGTLVAGAATVTFYHLATGDLLAVFPTTQGGTLGNHGSLYIAYTDSSTEAVTVQSTNGADTRSFTVVKIANAIVAA